MAAQNPVIVVPGITASVLEDRYPIDPVDIWNASTKKDFERITLHPDDLRYEAQEPARVVARNPIQLAYGDLVEALRHDLSKKKDKPTPVFAFGYDWRRDCFLSAAQLGAMVDEVLERTRLLPHYKKEPPERVDLVAHSMGGLVVAAYLRGKQTGAIPGISQGDCKVGRVVTIGTPFHGSVDAVHKLATGMGSLTGPAPRDREREAARMMPALYQLLPSFPEAAVGSVDRLPVDLFDRVNWQKSVLATMKEFIRMVGSEREPIELFEQFLGDAKRLIETVNQLDLDGPNAIPEGRAGWLAIVGLGAKTLSHVEVERAGPWFKLLEPADVGPKDIRTGDGTVPFRGAQPEFLERERLVAVTPDDFSIWEVGDKALLHFAGFHGMLPNVNLVQRLAIRHLRADYRAEFWAHPVPGVTTPQWPAWIERRPL